MSHRRTSITGKNLGITLVELLIALAIIGITFGALALTQVRTLQVNTASRSASDATEFANRWLEAEVQAVLDAFAATQTACPVDAPCVEAVGSGRFQGTGTTVTAGTGYLDAGLVRLSIVMAEPAEVTFTRLVSCLDVNPPPSVAVPTPCPGAM